MTDSQPVLVGAILENGIPLVLEPTAASEALVAVVFPVAGDDLAERVVAQQLADAFHRAVRADGSSGVVLADGLLTAWCRTPPERVAEMLPRFADALLRPDWDAEACRSAGAAAAKKPHDTRDRAVNQLRSLLFPDNLAAPGNAGQCCDLETLVERHQKMLTRRPVIVASGPSVALDALPAALGLLGEPRQFGHGPGRAPGWAAVSVGGVNLGSGTGDTPTWLVLGARSVDAEGVRPDALIVLAELFGSGPASLLRRTLTDIGITGQLHSAYVAGDAPWWYVALEVPAGQVAELESIVRETFEVIIDRRLSESAFEAARRAAWAPRPDHVRELTRLIHRAAAELDQPGAAAAPTPETLTAHDVAVAARRVLAGYAVTVA
ncbi:hypothetical protein ACWT_6090 [Actinoplanes sp. SE50]|uniref:insulinase family protein n=1 Tax=unclassified Actinoplanes TaxID=2626549 RepID=UPI00023ECA1C|nr:MULTISPECIES: insulinase family protein [unclassified Actinoplanes]AEV87107.1 hypothetical protein ACPL_6222 [Actinoplanes sp. SE50/110]ATO85505.1 hypothetical protein ACWT_6090 [Actinoplanes sp. SE50]SLM02917.1 uncharacterized protein ACSP50_6202 [Actinoplanes sp. SE50/110]